jgi:hypothetical protein
MISPERSEYERILRERRQGHPSELGPDATLTEAKPHFYADARLLIDGVTKAYRGLRTAHPPYGLLDSQGDSVTSLRSGQRGWTQLEATMARSATVAFNATSTGVTRCPYIPALINLIETKLEPVDNNEHGLDRLREITVPGARLAPTTIVNLLRRIPEMGRLHGATVSNEALARNSVVSLLDEPLHHPQQWAKPFNFCLATGVDGPQGSGIDRSDFLPEERILALTKLGTDQRDNERLEWAMPTANFPLLIDVYVVNRSLGSESDLAGDHVTVYPAGQRLGDIAVNEPTIGCPGAILAREMWAQGIDAITGEGMWDR